MCTMPASLWIVSRRLGAGAGRRAWPALSLALAALIAVAAAEARGMPDFSELAEDNAAAVVNISTLRKPPSRGGDDESPEVPPDVPWPEFFEKFFERHTPFPVPRPPTSVGSGFIISDDGYVITNHHVVDGVEEITVKLSDRRELPAELVGTDELSDIALLKIEAEDLPAVRIGSSDAVKVGQWVLAIGAPFGFEHSVTAGIVSAKGRRLPSGNYVPFIQTDVAINPGNSGGPLFSLDGEVIGVNSQIYSRTGSYSGLSFAVPISLAMDVVRQLRADGQVSRGWLGVYIQDVTQGLSESFGLDKPRGALIARIIEDSPAQQAGLRVGDIVLGFNDVDIGLSSSLPPLVGRTPAGERVMLELLRDGERLQLAVVVGELPDEQRGTPRTRKPRAPEAVLGLSLRPLTPGERERPGLDDGGLVVEKVGPGAARDAGIVVGDVLVMMNNKRFRTPKELAEIVASLPKGNFTTLLVVRGESSRFFALRIPE